MRFVLVLLAAALLHAEAPQLPEPYQTIAGLAYGAPPEFAADALLRIVEYGRLADKAQKRDLIEQAFRLAGSAKFPVRMTGIPGIADTRSGSLNQAYAFGLDALSLQSRAVRDMLPLDTAKGRELFLEIAPPTLAPLSCDDALVYDVSAYYEALEGVVNLAFTPKERAKQDHLSFLLDYLGQAASPAQIAPLVPVVESAGVTQAQREVLWAKLNGLLGGLQPDDRSFTASLPALSALNVPEMQSAFAAYKQRGHVCAHDSGVSQPLSKKPGQQDSADATPKLDHYWQSSATQQLFQAGQKLRLTSQKGLRNEANQSSPDWQQQLTDYLAQLAGWTSGLENSEADFFHEKCDVYQSLVELVPAGPQQEQLLSDYVSFLANSNLYQDSPVEWFVGPQGLMERLQGNGHEIRQVFDAFLASGNPVLALEARLHQFLPTGTPEWFTSRR